MTRPLATREELALRQEIAPRPRQPLPQEILQSIGAACGVAFIAALLLTAWVVIR